MNKKVKLFLITLLLLSTNIKPLLAECTDEEKNTLSKEIKKVEITYKHLGEVTKNDNTKVYNEYLVTAKNIPNDVYVHLYPYADNEFKETDKGLEITLTTGKWNYNLYSSKCDEVIDTIEVNLPVFNKYSLSPLCKEVDTDEFRYCYKYYSKELDEKTFTQKVKEYRRLNNLDKKTEIITKKDSITTKIYKYIKNFVIENYIYLLGGLLLFIIILVIIKINKSKKRKAILE